MPVNEPPFALAVVDRLLSTPRYVPNRLDHDTSVPDETITLWRQLAVRATNGSSPQDLRCLVRL